MLRAKLSKQVATRLILERGCRILCVFQKGAVFDFELEFVFPLISTTKNQFRHSEPALFPQVRNLLFS